MFITRIEFQTSAVDDTEPEVSGGQKCGSL